MEYSLNKVLLIIIIGLSFGIYLHAQDVSDSLSTSNKIPFQYDKQEWQETGAISTVKSDELKSFTSNVATSLYGKIPGLTVMQGSGEAGVDMPSLYIRGLSTFSSGSVFIIVDGMPSSEIFFQQLSPSEIESISILKDAAATAIYGQRAANGVLVIKTKRGTESPLQLNIDLQYGWQSMPRIPDFLNSYDYATLYNEAYQNDYGVAGYYSQQQLDAYRNASDPIHYPNVNWYDELLKKQTPLQNYSFTAKGGGKTANYFVAVNVVNNSGILKETEDVSELTKNQSYARYNFRTNVDIQLTNSLAAFITFGGTVEDKTTPGVNDGTDHIFNLMGSIAPNAFPLFVAPDKPGGTSMYQNPWSEITQRGFVSYNGRAAQAAVKLSGDLGVLLKGLSISGSVGFNSYFRSFSKKSGDYVRYSVQKDSEGNDVYTSYGQDSGGLSGSEGDSYQWRNYVLQGTIQYDNVFGKHAVNSMLMFYYDDVGENNNYGMNTQGTLPYLNVGMGGNLTYSFDKRYVAEFSLGYSGNNNFYKGKRFGFFPTGSLAWVISNEEFLKNNDIVNHLKVRGSYGLTGNNEIGGTRFMYNQMYDWRSYNLGTNNGGRDGMAQSTLANTDVTWEKEKQMNIALEASLFGHFDVTFDYFQKNRYDILARPWATVPDFAVAELPFMNVGKVDNKGFEATVRYSNRSSNDLKYFVEAGAWFAKNKIVFNAEQPQPEHYLYSTGQFVGQPFVLEAIGLFKDQDDIDKSPTHTFSNVQPGDVKYKDQNNDGFIDNNDYYPLGYTSMPELSLSFRPGVSYKGFDLDMAFQAAVNRSVNWGGKYFHAFQYDGKISSVALDRWTPQTAESATYPRLSATDNLNNYRESTLWLKNGNFLKLRSLELGYSLPNNIVKKVNVEKIRFFFNGTNLFSIDHMEGFMDPESNSGGLGYPVMRTLSLGINVQL